MSLFDKLSGFCDGDYKFVEKIGTDRECAPKKSKKKADDCTLNYNVVWNDKKELFKIKHISNKDDTTDLLFKKPFSTISAYEKTMNSIDPLSELEVTHTFTKKAMNDNTVEFKVIQFGTLLKCEYKRKYVHVFKHDIKQYPVMDYPIYGGTITVDPASDEPLFFNEKSNMLYSVKDGKQDKCYYDTGKLFMLTQEDNDKRLLYSGKFTEDGFTGYDKEGYDKEGYNKNGYDRTGYNKEGRDKNGYDRTGFNKEEGRDRGGFNLEGYNREGRDRGGFNREGYNRDGYDREGYNREGYNKKRLDKNGLNMYGKPSKIYRGEKTVPIRRRSSIRRRSPSRRRSKRVYKK